MISTAVAESIVYILACSERGYNLSSFWRLCYVPLEEYRVTFYFWIISFFQSRMNRKVRRLKREMNVAWTRRPTRCWPQSGRGSKTKPLYSSTTSPAGYTVSRLQLNSTHYWCSRNNRRLRSSSMSRLPTLKFHGDQSLKLWPKLRFPTSSTVQIYMLYYTDILNIF